MITSYSKVVLDDGNVSTKTHDILNKWKADFSHLFNVNNVNYENLHATAYTNQSNLPVDHLFNEHISLFEVKQKSFSVQNRVKHAVLIIYHPKLSVMTQRFLFFIFCLIFVLMLVSSRQTGEIYH